MEKPAKAQALGPLRRASEREAEGNQAETRQTRSKTKKTKIRERAEEEWKKRWQESSKGRELHKLTPEPTQENRHLHARRTKAYSALLTQLRTGKIGFSDFLYKRRVPGV